MTYLYIIGVNGDELPCKIGISEDPDKRLASLQCGSHRLLALREVYWLDTRDQALRAERRFHDEFAEFRMNSEWFGVTFDQANYWLFQLIDAPSIRAAEHLQ